MNEVSGRWRVAIVAGSLALVGGPLAALAQQETSPISEERGRVGAAERMKQSRPEAQQAAKPVAAEVRMLAVTGTVVSVDQEARTVILRDDEGSEFTVQVPANEPSLDQLKEGDRIDVNILQPLELAPPTDERQ
jgi:hypothetical protein